MTAKNEIPASDAAPPGRLSFPRDRRIRSGLDFQRIYAGKMKAANSCLLLFAARNSYGRTRIGLSVSRRNGNSIVRHRLRRMLRESYRLEQHHIPEGLDFILIPGRNAQQATIQQFRSAIVSLALRVKKQLDLAENSSPPPKAASS